MQPKSFAITILLTLFSLSSLSFADNPTEPELTEEDVVRIVAEEQRGLTMRKKCLSPLKRLPKSR